MDYIIKTKEVSDKDKSRPADKSEDIHAKEDNNADKV